MKPMNFSRFIDEADLEVQKYIKTDSITIKWFHVFWADNHLLTTGDYWSILKKISYYFQCYILKYAHKLE